MFYYQARNLNFLFIKKVKYILFPQLLLYFCKTKSKTNIMKIMNILQGGTEV